MKSDKMKTVRTFHAEGEAEYKWTRISNVSPTQLVQDAQLFFDTYQIEYYVEYTDNTEVEWDL